MAKNNISAFSTSDDKYAVHSAVSLLSVRKHRPDIDLYLIGTKYSADTKKFLKKHNITPIEVDLRDRFHTAWEYPVECYYIFAGPEILHERGYKYSVYVDGDTYCNNDPFDFQLATIKDFAGAFTKSSVEAILGKDTEVASRLYPNHATLKESRIQTGIVYFNNASVAKKGFLDKISRVYQEAIDSGIPRKGDDSLLALFRLAYPSWGYLDLGENYNKVTTNTRLISRKEWLVRDEETITDGVFFHFTNHTKPWVNTSKFPTYTHEYFYHAWRRHAIDTLSEDELKHYYPSIYSLLTDDHLRYYWYPTTNVGDLITPYYLVNVCGVEDLDKYKITEHGIRRAERLHSYSKIVSQKTRSIYVRLKDEASSRWRRVKPHTPLGNQISNFLAALQKAKRKTQNTYIRIDRKIKRATKTLFPKIAVNKTGNRKSKKAAYSVSTGSVIRLCGSHAMVFGSGIRSRDQPTSDSLVRVVRGPRTRSRFLEMNNACPPIYGDPGLLLPRFYNPKKSAKKYALGLIPHFTEYDDIAEQYRDHENVLVIDMASGDLEGVIDQINSCDRTISSSLHGLVLSHAYGVPTRQIEYSDRINGDGTKFLDYYEGIGLKRLDPINAAGLKYLSPAKLLNYKFETLENYDDRKLMDAMFFSETGGFKPSARYPYA